MPYLYIALHHIPPGSSDFHFKQDWDQFKNAMSELKFTQKLSAERILEVFYSRLCLKLALKKKGVHLLWRDLGLNENFRLHQLSKLPISISHTKSISIAVVAENDYIESIGVDIEDSTREIPDKISNFMSNSNDIKISNLKKWCLKEAAYKCFSHCDKPIKMKELQVNEKQVIHKDHSLSCNWDNLEFKQLVLP